MTKNNEKFCVWGFGVPSVCTAAWDNDAWGRWEDASRPPDYHGGKYDRAAWRRYINQRTFPLFADLF